MLGGNSVKASLLLERMIAAMPLLTTMPFDVAPQFWRLVKVSVEFRINPYLQHLNMKTRAALIVNRCDKIWHDVDDVVRAIRDAANHPHRH